MEKTCSLCKKRKSLVEFSHNRTSKDGYAWDCKDCHNGANMRWRKNNVEKYGEHMQTANKQWRRYKKEHEATAKLGWQKEKGSIKPKPCCVCDTTTRVHAHHYLGYSNPLDVIWLCPRHHSRIHKYIKEEIRVSVLEERERIKIKIKSTPEPIVNILFLEGRNLISGYRWAKRDVLALLTQNPKGKW